MLCLYIDDRLCVDFKIISHIPISVVIPYTLNLVRINVSEIILKIKHFKNDIVDIKLDFHIVAIQCFKP